MKSKKPSQGITSPSERLKPCLAAAAPALIPLVILISTDALTMLKVTSLDRIGLLAGAVVLISLSYLLWRRRWWAGLPSFTIFVLAGIVFAWKAVRPLWAYYKVNAFNGPTGGLEPLMMISPSLVMIVLAVLLGRLVMRGMRTSFGERGAPVSLTAWGVIILWVALLVGDAAYQEVGWRYVKNPSDLVLHLCLGDQKQRETAEAYLMDMGPKAYSALLQGASAPGPELSCLRERSQEMLERMGPPPVRNARVGLNK